MSGKDFAAWMDANGVTNQVAAELFGVSEQNIYNWRSTRGVPGSKSAWVQDRMAEFTEKRGTETLQNLVVEVTRLQFREWNRAALLQGKLVEEWAADVLDEAAAEALDDSTGSALPFNPLQSVRVADEGTPYKGKD